MNQTGKPIIVGFVADLMFTMRLENAARALGYEIQWIESLAQLGEPLAEAPAHKPGEYLAGLDGVMVDRLVRWQPALLVFDLNNDLIPWRQWIAALKSSPATRRMPILCFGSHKDVEAIELARKAGADSVVARSRFATALPRLIEQHARSTDRKAVAAACAEPLAAKARRGIELANEGSYYEAHEELEHAWMDDRSAGRDLYRSILQVAVAYLQIQRENYNGAVKMLLRVRQWLAPLPDVCRGVNVARLREDVDAVYTALKALGPDGIKGFDWSLVRSVEIVD